MQLEEQNSSGWLTRAEGRAQLRPAAKLLPARAFCIVMEAIVTV